MTDLMGELNAAEREADRMDILADLWRAGLVQTVRRLMNCLGMNEAEAWDEIEAHIFKGNAA